jgi:hypothetical protein
LFLKKRGKNGKYRYFKFGNKQIHKDKILAVANGGNRIAIHVFADELQIGGRGKIISGSVEKSVCERRAFGWGNQTKQSLCEIPEGNKDSDAMGSAGGVAGFFRRGGFLSGSRRKISLLGIDLREVALTIVSIPVKAGFCGWTEMMKMSGETFCEMTEAVILSESSESKQ